MGNASDSDIFKYAVRNNYTIVTFDSDFCDLNNFNGFPIKIIWLRTGNMTTIHLEIIFRRKYDLISSFLMEEENGCLEIII